MIAVDALAHLIRTDILEFPERHEWSIQGFGMLRTYLAPDLRLHVWDPDFRVQDVSDIHDHPWNFESIVLSGSIENRRYRIRPSDATPTHWQGRIVCGPNPVEHGAKDIRSVHLEQWCEGIFRPGDTYKMQADELHASIPTPGCVTLIQRTKADKDPERAFVYWPLGTNWISAEPRPATPSEWRRITRRALDCWSST